MTKGEIGAEIARAYITKKHIESLCGDLKQSIENSQKLLDRLKATLAVEGGTDTKQQHPITACGHCGTKGPHAHFTSVDGVRASACDLECILAMVRGSEAKHSGT